MSTLGFKIEYSHQEVQWITSLDVPLEYVHWQIRALKYHDSSSFGYQVSSVYLRTTKAWKQAF